MPPPRDLRLVGRRPGVQRLAVESRSSGKARWSPARIERAPDGSRFTSITLRETDVRIVVAPSSRGKGIEAVDPPVGIAPGMPQRDEIPGQVVRNVDARVRESDDERRFAALDFQPVTHASSDDLSRQDMERGRLIGQTGLADHSPTGTAGQSPVGLHCIDPD